MLGEYNKRTFSKPVRKIYEALRETAFKSHRAYQHTTMGFLQMSDMPNMYDYSLEFFKRISTAGIRDDCRGRRRQARRRFADGQQLLGRLKRGNYTPEIPNEPEQTTPLSTEVAWPTPTLPWVAVSFKGPAYSDDQKDKPALDLISSLGFSQTSDLYQKLVIKEQRASRTRRRF